jgi:hypothetical protein
MIAFGKKFLMARTNGSVGLLLALKKVQKDGAQPTLVAAKPLTQSFSSATAYNRIMAIIYGKVTGEKATTIGNFRIFRIFL